MKWVKKYVLIGARKLCVAAVIKKKIELEKIELRLHVVLRKDGQKKLY